MKTDVGEGFLDFAVFFLFISFLNQHLKTPQKEPNLRPAVWTPEAEDYLVPTEPVVDSISCRE